MDIFTIIVPIVAAKVWSKPHIKPVNERDIMINGMNFKTDCRLGIPDFIDFVEDGSKFLWSSAAVGQMYPQIYTIDRLKDWFQRYCFRRSSSI